MTFSSFHQRLAYSVSFLGHGLFLVLARWFLVARAWPGAERERLEWLKLLALGLALSTSVGAGLTLGWGTGRGLTLAALFTLPVLLGALFLMLETIEPVARLDWASQERLRALLRTAGIPSGPNTAFTRLDLFLALRVLPEEVLAKQRARRLRCLLSSGSGVSSDDRRPRARL